MAGQGGKTEHSSLDSISENCKNFGSVGNDAVKLITQKALKKKKLQPLVDQYLKSTVETLNYFNTVEKCVKKAKKIQQLEIESLALSSNGPNMGLQSCTWLKSAFTAVNLLDMDFEGHKKNKNVEILEKLKEVKAMEDPFGDELETQFESVYKENLKLLVKSREVQVMIKKKLKKAKIWMGVGVGFTFVTFFASLGSSLALASIHGHGLMCLHAHTTVTVAKVLVISAGVDKMTKTVTTVLEEYEKSLKKRNELSQLTRNSTEGNIEEIKTIKGLVDALITRVSSIMETDEVAMEKREEESMKLLMQEITKKVKGFAEKIEEVCANVAKSRASVVKERDRVRKHIAN